MLFLIWVVDWFEFVFLIDRVVGFIFVLIFVGLVSVWIYFMIRNIIISVLAVVVGAAVFVVVYILKLEFYDNVIVRFFKWFLFLSRY